MSVAPLLTRTSRFIRPSSLSIRMVSSTPNVNVKATNRSGLTPEESKNLAPRQPSNDESGFLKRLAQLYGCDGSQITDDTYSMFTEDATFHDPVGHATPLKHIKEQFNGLSQIFEKATIDKQTLLTNPPNLPDTTLLVDQVISYYRKASQPDPTKTVNSLITLERNAQGRVVHFQEEWDHKGEKDSSDGFLGKLSEWRKTLTVKASSIGLTPDPHKV